MKIQVNFFITIILVFCCLLACESRSRQNPFVMTIKKAKPAVVKINSSTGYASGIIIDKDNGYILTNHHVILTNHPVIDGSTPFVTMTLFNGRLFWWDKIEVLGYDHLSDLALLKVDPGDEQLTEIEWGDSDNVQVGEWAIAIGHPLAIKEEQTQPTVTAGIISATNQVDLYEDPYEFEKYHFEKNRLNPPELRFFIELIQTDASINPGNSGGPLVNIDGQLIGINTFIRTADEGSRGSIGIGFAIPSNTAKKVVQQIKRSGCVVPPELGMEVKPVIVNIDGDIISMPVFVPDNPGFYLKPGVLVSKIEPQGPADSAGIELGDIIITIANDRIQNQTHFKAITRLLPTDKEIQFVIERNGENQEVTLLTKKWKEYAAPRWGMRAKQPTLAERTSKYKRHGVIVTHVEQWLAEKDEIKPGDLVYQIDDRKIHSLEEFKMAYKAAATSYRDLTIHFERDGKDLKKDKDVRQE